MRSKFQLRNEFISDENYVTDDLNSSRVVLLSPANSDENNFELGNWNSSQVLTTFI